MTLGAKMRLIRELHGKTLEDVAPRIGLDESSLSRIERNLQAMAQDAHMKWLALFFMTEKALREFEDTWPELIPDSSPDQ